MEKSWLKRKGLEVLVISATENIILHAKYLLCDSIQFSSVAQSCSTLCDPMDYSTLGFPVHHQLPELAQTHTHWVSVTIQPSPPLFSSSPPAFNFPPQEGLFQGVSSSHQLAKYWSFRFSIIKYSGLNSFRIDW